MGQPAVNTYTSVGGFLGPEFYDRMHVLLHLMLFMYNPGFWFGRNGANFLGRS